MLSFKIGMFILKLVISFITVIIISNSTIYVVYIYITAITNAHVLE